MAIFIDPPLWPAHGTHFAHMISDTSLAELHEFAATAGVNERAFDRDHYDVPEGRCAELARLGAQRVDGRTLVRTLVASGLRVPARERSDALIRPLTQRWNDILPDDQELGAELLKRWGEDHRHYHDRAHLLNVLESLDRLTDASNPPRTVVLAAWFHDAVYNGVAGEDEEWSARLAEDRLTQAGLGQTEVAEVARLVRLTSTHDPEPGDDAEALLCDADLSVLGRSAPGFRRYLDAVRAEYAHVGDADFKAGRAAVVRGLLAFDPLFRTPAGRGLWEEKARKNLESELARH